MVSIQTARFQVPVVDVPVFQVVAERKHTHLVDQMQFARSIEIQYRIDASRISIEEELVGVRNVIVAQFQNRFERIAANQSAETRLWQSIECAQ